MNPLLVAQLASSGMSLFERMKKRRDERKAALAAEADNAALDELPGGEELPIAQTGVISGIKSNPALTTSLISEGADRLKDLRVLINSPYDKAEKARLEDLQRRMEEGTLGLTQEEKDTLDSELRQKDIATERALETRRGQQLATGILGGGQALALSQGQEESSRRVAQDRALELQALDIERGREQEEEYWAREANQSERFKEKIGAVLGVSADAADKAEEVASVKNTLEGSAVSEQQYKELADQLNMNVDELKIMMGVK